MSLLPEPTLVHINSPLENEYNIFPFKKSCQYVQDSSALKLQQEKLESPPELKSSSNYVCIELEAGNTVQPIQAENTVVVENTVQAANALLALQNTE